MKQKADFALKTKRPASKKETGRLLYIDLLKS
jgi:hypothetical protein